MPNCVAWPYALEEGTTFEIQIAGQRIYVPRDATIEFEYERRGEGEEVEIELIGSVSECASEAR